MTNVNRQRGATLITALLFLVIMTLFAVSAINMSMTNFKIVGNMQAQKQLDAYTKEAIEKTLSSMAQFNLTPAKSTMSTPVGTVNIDAPVCIDTRTATGYSAVVQNIIPEDNTWEVTAHVTDSLTGAHTYMHQGVQIRMLAGNCPAPPVKP